MNTVCSVCQAIIATGKIFVTPCGHVFHFDCIEKQLSGSVTCPQCHQITTPIQIRHQPHIVLNDLNNEFDDASEGMKLKDKINYVKCKILQTQEELALHNITINIVKERRNQLIEEIDNMKSDFKLKTAIISHLKELVTILNTEYSEHVLPNRQSDVKIQDLKRCLSVVKHEVEQLGYEIHQQWLSLGDQYSTIKKDKEKRDRCMAEIASLEHQLKELEILLKVENLKEPEDANNFSNICIMGLVYFIICVLFVISIYNILGRGTGNSTYIKDKKFVIDKFDHSRQS